MRRWIVDRLRLLARWALKRWIYRLLIFAFMPTQREIAGLIEHARATFFVCAGAPDAPRRGNTLH